MVYILLGAGFEEAEALVPADLLRRAGIPVTLVSLQGREITGGHQITVIADKLLSEITPDDAELLLLPGGLGGVAAIRNCPRALSFICQMYDTGKYLAAICAAPTILGALGLLENRQAVCYPGMEEQLTGAIVRKGAAVVTDGTLITSEAAGSAFDFGLKLVELLRGSSAAEQVRNAVHYHG